jgi:hypothetical protein
VLHFRIHLTRIRIQHFRLNTDPYPIWNLIRIFWRGSALPRQPYLFSILIPVGSFFFTHDQTWKPWVQIRFITYTKEILLRTGTYILSNGLTCYDVCLCLMGIDWTEVDKLFFLPGLRIRIHWVYTYGSGSGFGPNISLLTKSVLRLIKKCFILLCFYLEGNLGPRCGYEAVFWARNQIRHPAFVMLFFFVVFICSASLVHFTYRR